MQIEAKQRLRAMPRLIKPGDLTKSFIEYVRTNVQHLFDAKDSIVKAHPLNGVNGQLFSVFYTPTQGTWFTVDSKGAVEFVYYFQSFKLDSVVASEALAYRWGYEVPFVLKDVFFVHMLPSLKFIITDSEYTPSGARWFRNQYAFAFANPEKYKVYVVDTQTGKFTQIQRQVFGQNLKSWWGRGERFTRWRFAIEEI